MESILFLIINLHNFIQSFITDIVIGNRMGDGYSNLDEAVYVSFHANALREKYQSSVLPSAMWKIVGQTGFFSHV